MTSYRLTRLAHADMNEIWDYSETHWGAEQADRYIADLFACFARAVATPEAGRDRSAFVPGARSMASGRHLVFYRQTRGEIVILRIVHEARHWAALSYADELG